MKKAVPLGTAFAFSGVSDLYDRIMKLVVDASFYLSIIRPTSGAVETENSLLNNKLRSFRRSVFQVIEARRKLKKRC